MALDANDIADMLVSFSMIDNDIAENILNYIFAWPDIYEIDNVLLPVALQMAESTANHQSSPMVCIRQTVITHLQTRLTEPLEPPADWKRENTMNCSCRDCSELKRFLSHPEQAQWRFTAAEARRSHLQHAISRSKSDVDCATDKKGRPYTLVCTKNQASYQCRVEQSHRDQEALTCLLAV
jgi:hypothetical protein